jgi:hypothetical protein
MTDLAIVGQDPGFLGGVLTQTEALWNAAVTLGRKPELHYLRYPRLDEQRGEAVLEGRGVSPLVPRADLLNVLGAAARLAPRVRRAQTRFICAATGSSGFAAVLAGRPYG